MRNGNVSLYWLRVSSFAIFMGIFRSLISSSMPSRGFFRSQLLIRLFSQEKDCYVRIYFKNYILFQYFVYQIRATPDARSTCFLLPLPAFRDRWSLKRKNQSQPNNIMANNKKSSTKPIHNIVTYRRRVAGDRLEFERNNRVRLVVPRVTHRRNDRMPAEALHQRLDRAHCLNNYIIAFHT